MDSLPSQIASLSETAATVKREPMTDVVRPEARSPRGFIDRRARDLTAERKILAAVSDVYERYGFEALDTGAFEYADALGKFLPDADRPNEGVFALQDDADADGNGPWMALRYDLTAPLARFAAQNWATLPKPFRRYAFGPVWRNEKPGPGRYREFVQCDADTVGSARPEADAEIIAMAVAGLEAAGLPAGSAIVRINNRKLLNGLMTAAGVTSEVQKLVVLRAVDKLDRLGPGGVAQLLGEGRKDESGDFTTGAKLDARAIDTMLGFVTASAAGIDGALDRIEPLVQASETGKAGLAELRQIDELVKAAGYGTDRVAFDSTVVRGLEYYTGPVFEAELTFEVKGEDGRPVRFGSVGGGGRYDDLVARFTGQRVPATGFSIGVSRLQAALSALKRDTVEVSDGPVVVLVMDKAELPRYQSMAQTLRAAGIRAEMYLGTAGMKAQMKYADKRGAPCVVIQGSQEREKGEVQLKDLVEGAKAAEAIKDNKEWKASRPAQVSVAEADLVAEVRKILARHS